MKAQALRIVDWQLDLPASLFALTIVLPTFVGVMIFVAVLSVAFAAI